MTHGDPPVGSVAEEAARLIGLLCGDLDGASAWEAGARASARSGACPTCGHDGTAGPAVPDARDRPCRSCPVCQFVTFLREISPEVIDRVADVVELVGGGLRDLADSQRRSAARPPTSKDPAP